MEGIVLGIEAFVSEWAVIGGISLLATVMALVVLGYASEEESSGRRLYWAEWPIYGSEETSFEEKKLRLAA